MIPPLVCTAIGAQQARNPTGPPPPATPAFAQLGTSVKAAAATTIDVPWPATVSDNDIGFILVATTLEVANSISDWGGMTEIDQRGLNLDFYAGCAWKRLTAAEASTNVTIELSLATNIVACAITFSGCHATDSPPFEDVTINSGTSTSVTGSAIDTTGPNRLAVTLAMIGRGNAVAAMVSADGTWTERMDVNGTGGGTRCVVDTFEKASAGTVAAASTTITSDDWVTATFALYG
jgi:hypothetical protein